MSYINSVVELEKLSFDTLTIVCLGSKIGLKDRCRILRPTMSKYKFRVIIEKLLLVW